MLTAALFAVLLVVLVVPPVILMFRADRMHLRWRYALAAAPVAGTALGGWLVGAAVDSLGCHGGARLARCSVAGIDVTPLVGFEQLLSAAVFLAAVLSVCLLGDCVVKYNVSAE